MEDYKTGDYSLLATLEDEIIKEFVTSGYKILERDNDMVYRLFSEESKKYKHVNRVKGAKYSVSVSSKSEDVNSYYLYGDGSSSFTSDGRLKTDIVNLEDGYLEKFNTVRLVNFKWKAAPDSPAQMGVIAQEIEEIFPDLVSEDEDAIGTGETYKAVSYSKLNTIALKVIQELSAKVETLEARIAALEA